MASVIYSPLWKSMSVSSLVIDAENRQGDIDYRDRAAFTGDKRQTTAAAWGGLPQYTPALSDPNGSPRSIAMDDPLYTLEACIACFKEGTATRFSEGICRKLKQLLDNRYELRG
jgi:hypothetical protein